MEIKYTCSLGNECHTAQILKRNKLKLCSYPFDWIFLSCDNIIHCINYFKYKQCKICVTIYMNIFYNKKMKKNTFSNTQMNFFRKANNKTVTPNRRIYAISSAMNEYKMAQNNNNNVLFYGNCQIDAIHKILNLPNNKNVFHYYCCFNTNISQEEFTSLIKKCDIIITQPINDNYRNKPYLSTSFIIKNKNPQCKIIIFDSCHFDFYYFDLTYKKYNNDNLNVPISYHYNKMIECYNNGFSIEYYIDNYINNIDLKNSEELEELANDSLNQLSARYINSKNKYNGDNIFLISTYEFIKNNYKDKLLFYSMNHPTKYLIQFICEKIINILKIQNTIDYDIDPLDYAKCILYKCISKNVNFNIEKYIPLTLGYNDNYNITQLYYDTYKKIGFSCIIQL